MFRLHVFILFFHHWFRVSFSWPLTSCLPVYSQSWSNGVQTETRRGVCVYESSCWLSGSKLTQEGKQQNPPKKTHKTTNEMLLERASSSGVSLLAVSPNRTLNQQDYCFCPSERDLSWTCTGPELDLNWSQMERLLCWVAAAVVFLLFGFEWTDREARRLSDHQQLQVSTAGLNRDQPLHAGSTEKLVPWFQDW